MFAWSTASTAWASLVLAACSTLWGGLGIMECRRAAAGVARTDWRNIRDAAEAARVRTSGSDTNLERRAAPAGYGVVNTADDGSDFGGIAHEDDMTGVATMAELTSPHHAFDNVVVRTAILEAEHATSAQDIVLALSALKAAAADVPPESPAAAALEYHRARLQFMRRMRDEDKVVSAAAPAT